MEKWLESVYSDGSKYYVSCPIPSIGQDITIRIRLYKDAPVEHIFLRRINNGAEQLIKMERNTVKAGLAYYQCSLHVQEKLIHYQFYLVTKNTIYYYTQKEITTYIPDHTYDFKILAGYQQPEWVKGSVFYQIFPERFYNGNHGNDVKDGEYTYNGNPTVQIKEWNTPAPTYEEAFCMDFYGGDLEGIKEKIPYLKELGVSAIYLNPIFYAPSTHKYDCLDYFTVDPHFGGNEALAQLSEELHGQGMQLILDVSINHTGSAHKWFNKDGIFYNKGIGAYSSKDAKERAYYFINEDTGKYECWCGHESLPTLNYTSEELRDVIYRGEESLLKTYLKEPYNIDGWRFDVADVMCRKDEIQLHHEVWSEIRESIKLTNEKAYILAEDWGDCGDFLQGQEWDSPMNYFGCARPIRQFFGEPDLFNMRRPELKEVNYKMTARDLSNRIREHLNKLPTVIQQVQFNLLDSHDISRLHNSIKFSWEKYRGAIIMLFTLPGATSIYYGDEAGIDGRVGDDNGFRFPMPWETGFEKGRFYSLYHTLAALKKDQDAFINGGFRILSDDGYVFSYARFTENQVYITVCSFEDKERIIMIPMGIFGKREFFREKDIFGNDLKYVVNKKHIIELTVIPFKSYLIEL